MKKIITLILSLLMCLTVGLMATACGSGDNPPPTQKTWANYFVFDNVTATMTTSVNYVGTSDTYTMTEIMQKDGNKWSLKMILDYSEMTGNTYTDLAYWDGSQIHTSIESFLEAGDLKSKGENWYGEEELFAYVENEFTQTSEGVYEAESVQFSSNFSDIKIVFEGDNIKSIEYKQGYNYGGSNPMTEDVKIVFTSWGTTVVSGLA